MTSSAVALSTVVMIKIAAGWKGAIELAIWKKVPLPLTSAMRFETATGTSAALLARLASDPALGEDAGAILMRALGLFDLALKAKREGKKLGFYDPEREASQRFRAKHPLRQPPAPHAQAQGQ